MSVFDRLTGFNLPSGTTVTMSYSEGTDVFVHNETAVDDAIGYTDVIQTFSDLIATPGLQARFLYIRNHSNNKYRQFFESAPYGGRLASFGIDTRWYSDIRLGFCSLYQSASPSEK